MKDIYIILMHTRTIPDQIIRKITKYKYSHVVLSLDKSYKKLYSFGRKTVRNVFNAGFVTYGKGSAFFEKFKNTECLVLKLTVSKKQYKSAEKILKTYEENIDIYRYDIKGLLTRYFYYNGKKRKNYYVCSQFVATVIENAGIYNFGKPCELVKPIDFNKIPNIIKVYEGKFSDLK